MIYLFNDSKNPLLSEVGGKAKSLIEATREGFNVPEGLVLSVDFFKEWMEEIYQTNEWKEFLENPTKEACEKIQSKGESLRVSKKQKDVLDESMKNFPKDCFFAVRSSSPDEDMADKSFAGQYKTILGVLEEDIEKAILEVFLSVFDFRVVEYKKNKNMEYKNPQIAIIVQKLIKSEISGVGFSVNPKNNGYDEAMINASFGLGETIVSGQVTPDVYIYEKVKEKILEKQISDKNKVLWVDENDGVVEDSIAESRKQALLDSEIHQVAKLIIKCEKFYNRPVDIEWTMAENKLYLLQVRPITTYINFPKEMITKPGERKKLYLDLTVLTQGFSEPFSVLGIDIWTKFLVKVKQGTVPEGEDGIAFNVHGKQYLNMSNYSKGLGVRAAKKFIGMYEVPVREVFKKIDFENEYKALKASPKIKALKKNIFKILLRLLTIAPKGYINPTKALESYKAHSNGIYKTLKNDFLKDKPFEEIVADGVNIFNDFSEKVYSLFPGFIAMPRIKKIFKGKGVDDLIVSLGMDLPGNPTSKMGHHMLKLASYDEFQKTQSKEDFIEKLKNKNYSKEFLHDFNEYIDKYGGRGFKEIDIATPRIYDNPGELFLQLKAINVDDNRISDVRERKQQAYEKLLEVAKSIGKEKKFIKLENQYSSMFGYREDPKYLYVLMISELRKRVMELAEKFIKQGRLKNKEQIFDLTVEEIAKAEKDENINLQKCIKNNIEPRAFMKNITNWPKIVDSRGKIFRYVREKEEGDLIGDPISPGIIKGRAKVLNFPYEKTIEQGEILVTVATEPAWTPIFVNAAAVVLEVGGPLQHGAIIAREYGIPCVSGLEGAANLIKDGDWLEVDGTSGIVRIMK
jgi:phosphohistidine swiveling domain-containing protein